MKRETRVRNWKSERKRKQTEHTEKKDKQKKQHFFSGVGGNMPDSTQRMRYREGLRDVLVCKKDFPMMKNNPINLHFSS